MTIYTTIEPQLTHYRHRCGVCGHTWTERLFLSVAAASSRVPECPACAPRPAPNPERSGRATRKPHESR
jgi:hypothetical protein